MHPWIRKRDSTGAYVLTINDLRLTGKKGFKNSI